MTEPEAPRPRRHRRVQPETQTPGLYLVGRFGDSHDVLGTDWLGDVADADLAAFVGYARLALDRAQAEQERRVTPVEINSGSLGFMARQPDLRDLGDRELAAMRNGLDVRDAALDQLANMLNVPADAVKAAARGERGPVTVEDVELPPEVAAKVDEALADPASWVERKRPVRPDADAIPEGVLVIEETVGTKRPPMPWDND